MLDADYLDNLYFICWVTTANMIHLLDLIEFTWLTVCVCVCCAGICFSACPLSRWWVWSWCLWWKETLRNLKQRPWASARRWDSGRCSPNQQQLKPPAGVDSRPFWERCAAWTLKYPSRLSAVVFCMFSWGFSVESCWIVWVCRGWQRQGKRRPCAPSWIGRVSWTGASLMMEMLSCTALRRFTETSTWTQR